MLKVSPVACRPQSDGMNVQSLWSNMANQLPRRLIFPPTASVSEPIVAKFSRGQMEKKCRKKFLPW